MITYRVDELSFDLPEGFADRTLNVFFSPGPHTGILSLTIAREPVNDSALGERVDHALAAMKEALPSLRVVDRRVAVIGYLPAVETKIQATQDRVPVYQRQAFIEWFDRLLLVSITSTRQKSPQCDALAEKITASLRFRKP